MYNEDSRLTNYGILSQMSHVNEFEVFGYGAKILLVEMEGLAISKLLFFQH